MSVAGISSISNNTINNQVGVGLPQNETALAAQSPLELTPEEEKQVEELKKRDAEVRRHEQAHLNAAGAYARSGPRYDYEVGPNGKRYVIGGEVSLDISPVPNDPDATIAKARAIKQAALAPEKPSGQDYQIAAQAEQMEAYARHELAKERAEQTQTYNRNGRPQAQIVEPGRVNFSV